MDAELQQLKHKIRSLEDQLELATDQITEQEAREESFKNTETKLQQTIHELKKQLSTKEQALVVEVENIPVVPEPKPIASFEKELIEQFQQNLDVLTNEVEKLENEKNDLNSQLIEKSKMVEKMEQLAASFQSDLKNRESELLEVKEEIAFLRQNYSDACQQIEALNRNILDLSAPPSAPVASIGNNMFEELDRQRVVAELEFRKCHTQLEDARSQICKLQHQLRMTSQNARSGVVGVEELDYYKNLLKAQHDKSIRFEEQLSLLRKQTNILPENNQLPNRKLLEAKVEMIFMLQRQNSDLEKQLQEALAVNGERLNLLESNNALRRDLEIVKDELKIYKGNVKRRKESLPPPTPKTLTTPKEDSPTEDSTGSDNRREIMGAKAREYMKKYRKQRHVPAPEN